MKTLPGFILMVLLGLGLGGFSQQSADSVSRKNTIKMEITSLFLYRNALVFSFERMIKPNQSLTVTAGYQEFPKLSLIDSNASVRSENDRSGTKFGAEYRFYLAKENKYKGPHGVYIGPYASLLSFNGEKNIEVDNNGVIEKALLTSQFNVINLGFEVGYQFIINNRWAIDMVFAGPSFSNYKAKLGLEGNFTFDETDIKNEYLQKVIEKFPGLKNIFDGETVSASGNANKWGAGFRYQMHIGYHFGRKK